MQLTLGSDRLDGVLACFRPIQVISQTGLALSLDERQRNSLAHCNRPLLQDLRVVQAARGCLGGWQCRNVLDRDKDLHVLEKPLYAEVPRWRVAQALQTHLHHGFSVAGLLSFVGCPHPQYDGQATISLPWQRAQGASIRMD